VQKPRTRRVGRLIQTYGPGATVRKRGNVYFLFRKERRGIPWRLVITVFLVFVVSVGSAVTFATIYNVQRQIRLSQAELNRQRDTNLTLRTSMTERYTHDEMMRRARSLGLREPDPSQIIYFYASDYSQVTFIYTPSYQENYFWQGIVVFIRDAVNRIIS